MDEILLNEIPFNIDIGQLKTQLHIREDAKRAGRLEELVNQAQNIAKPKAVYRAAFVDSIGEDFVVIEGVKFTSRVLKSNLESVGRVFPFAVTCGSEIEKWSKEFSGIMEKFWIDGIKDIVVGSAMEHMTNHLTRMFELNKVGSMATGRIPDWSLSEQGDLVLLIGDIESLIGVKLTNSKLLIPAKSFSGLLYPTEQVYENCVLCTKKTCPNRKAPFDAKLYREKMGK